MPVDTVFSAFSVLKNHLKLKTTEDDVAIDNIVFRLHYRATFLILLGSCVLVTSRQFIGEHIRCITDKSVPSNVIDTFCFFTSTFTVPKHMNATLVREGELPHPGVGPAARQDPVVHHAYYQWVPFVLFFQALCFYLPHFLWKRMEGGHLKMLVSGLHMASLALREDDLKVNDKFVVPSKHQREEKIRDIRTAFMNRLHLNHSWAYYLGICEILNLLNVFLQFYLTDRFLGGSFINLGNSVTEERTDAEMSHLDIVFPKVTKCTFHKYGASGTIQKHDALCVMALNIVNEKIYVILWFWFIAMAAISLMGLFWRLLTMLLHFSRGFNRLVFSMACPGKYNPWNVLNVTREYDFGDWLFLYYIAKNLDNYVFRDLLQQLADDLEERRQARYKEFQSIEEMPLKKD